MTTKRTYYLKSIPEVEDSLFYCLYHNSVYDQLSIINMINYDHI